MKKLLLLTLILAIFCSILTSCKDATKTSTSSDATSKTAEVSATLTSQESTTSSEKESVVSDVTSSEKENVSSKPAKEETSSKPDEVHKHSYVKKVVKPTCTKDGYTKYTCECGKSYKDKETEKLGHDYTEWKTTKKATTKSEGVKTRTCERCGITKNKNIPKKESSANVSSKIEVSTRFGITKYKFKKISVDDKRTWGEAPTITIGDDDSLHVTYYNKKGEKVQFTVQQPVKTDIINLFTIRDDGTYVSDRIGSYS